MFFIFNNKEIEKRYEGALQVLFENNYKRVYRLIMSITLDGELAKDVTQEAFLRAFLKIDTLKDKDKFSQWVCSIAINVCRDMLKQKIIYRNKNMSLYDTDGNMKDNVIPLSDLNSPEKMYEDNETKQKMQKYIKELDVEERQIIVLKYYNNLTYAQIAEQINIKESTLGVKALRAKEKIVNKLRKYSGIEEHKSNG